MRWAEVCFVPHSLCGVPGPSPGIPSSPLLHHTFTFLLDFGFWDSFRHMDAEGILDCLGHWFSKCFPWTTSIRITREFCYNVNSWALSPVYWIRGSGRGVQRLCWASSSADSDLTVLKLAAQRSHLESFADYWCQGPTSNDSGFNSS